MKIALVCALNLDQNPGMVTVDRAAIEFFSGRGLDIDWLVAGLDEDQSPGVNDLSGFRSVFDEEGYPDKYDRIVFWGDFLQSRVHHASLAKLLLKGGRATGSDQASKSLRKHLLLEGASTETLRKVAIVGSSMHADNAELFIDTEYRHALSRILSNACSVRMREPLSSYRATMLSGRDGTAGLDAAFLRIKNNTWKTDSENHRQQGPLRIAVVGGRSDRYSGRKFKFACLAALKRFERSGVETNLEVLPWLTESLGRWGWFSVETSSQARSPDYCLERSASCDALITNVYHAAINAWVLGIPVAMLGTGAEIDSTTINSKKKELLSLSMFAGKNYIFYEDISYSRPFVLGRCIFKILTADLLNREIFEQRKRDAVWLWDKLEGEIDLPKKTDFPGK